MFRLVWCLAIASRLLQGNPPNAGGRIEGVVLRADTAEGIVDAKVALSTEDGRVLQSVQSGPDGHYSIFGIEDRGRFYVTASKLGFISSSVGSVRPGGSGSAISMASSAILQDANIRLTVGAVVVGRVLDETGTPVPNVKVTVSRWDYAPGLRTLVPQGGGEARSGRLGQFRIFGLPQGKYILAFERNEITATIDVRTVDGNPVEVPTMYFPSVTSLAEATEISLVPGREFSAGDTHLRAVRSHRVTGTVTTDGQPTEGVSIRLKPLAGGTIRATKTNALGKFDFVNVPTLDHVVNAQATDGAWAQSILHASQLDDLRSLDLALAPAISIRCRVNADGRPGIPGDVVASLVELDAEGLFSPRKAQIDSDGALSFSKLLPGRYRFVATSRKWTVESIRDRGRDITDTPIEVTPTEVPDVFVELSSTPARLAGTLVDPVGRPMSAHIVVLFGDSPNSWTPASTRIRSTRPDQFGTYEFSGLPEGSYRLVVLTDVDDGQWLAPGFLNDLSKSALLVILSRGQQRVLDLRAER